MPTQKSYRSCQSCGMPMKRDEKGGGSNADGSKSTVYCSHCYDAGQFTAPGLTATDMKARVVEKLKQSGFPPFAVGLMTSGIPKLARWRR